MPKGLATAVLAALPVQAGIAGAGGLSPLVYAGVFLSVVATAVLVFLGFSWWSSLSFATPEGDQASTLFGNFAIGLGGYAGVGVIVVVIAVLTAITSHITVVSYLSDIDVKPTEGG